MCGQFAIFSNIRAIIDYYHFLLKFEDAHHLEGLEEYLKTKKDKTPYNKYEFPNKKITPSMYVPVLFKEKDQIKIDWKRWGLIPSWSKDESFANKLINARIETLHEKASFKQALRSRRCLIPCNYFYEWDSHKNKHEISIEGKEIISLGGLWEEWKSNDQIISTFSIITQNAEGKMSDIHERSPLVIQESSFYEWLNCESVTDFPNISSLLKVI